MDTNRVNLDDIRPGDLLTDEQVAQILGCTRKTLANRRAKRLGPKAVKVVGKARYYGRDLTKWLLEERERQSRVWDIS